MDKDNKCGICKGHTKLIYKLDNQPATIQNLSTIEKAKSIDLEIGQCKDCNTVQLINYTPVTYYRECIRNSKLSNDTLFFRKIQFDILKNTLDTSYNFNNYSIIELGANEGEFLDIAKTLGFNCYGIENNFNRQKIINNKYDFIDKYNAFCSFNYIEHIPDVRNTLTIFNEFLEDNAIGIIEVPNANTILQNNMFSEFSIEHIYYFTKHTLRILLNLCGFEILTIDNIFNNYVLSAQVRKLPKLDLSNMDTTKNKLTKELHEYLKDNPNTAVYGAGHQSLCILSSCRLKNKIKFVIDDSKDKQNKFTPATNIKIYGKEKLNEVDSVILICGSYNKEIAKIIKSEYNIKIAHINHNRLEIIDG